VLGTQIGDNQAAHLPSPSPCSPAHSGAPEGHRMGSRGHWPRV
ncbi:hypothetical protein Cadr_000031176, partial [Camelus dromedarius]